MHDLTPPFSFGFLSLLNRLSKQNFPLSQTSFIHCSQDSQALTFRLKQKKTNTQQKRPTNTQQSYDFKPLNHTRIKSGKVENIPSSLERVWWWLRWDERQRQQRSLMDGPPTTRYSTGNGWRRSAEIPVYSVRFVPPQDRVYSQEISISQCFPFVFFWKLFWRLECKKKCPENDFFFGAEK